MSTKKRKCLTPGTWFLFRTGQYTQWASDSNSAELLLTLPPHVVLTKERAGLLNKALHDAAEKAMAPWFQLAQKE